MQNKKFQSKLKRSRVLKGNGMLFGEYEIKIRSEKRLTYAIATKPTTIYCIFTNIFENQIGNISLIFSEDIKEDSITTKRSEIDYVLQSMIRSKNERIKKKTNEEYLRDNIHPFNIQKPIEQKQKDTVNSMAKQQSKHNLDS